MENQATKHASAPKKQRVSPAKKTMGIKKQRTKRPTVKRDPARKISPEWGTALNEPAAVAVGGFKCLLNFKDITRMPKLELVDLIREGVPPSDFKEMVKRMGVSQGKVVNYLGVSTATINRKSLRNEHLSPDESARVLGLASLIGQVQVMVERSGDPTDFDAAKWISNWLDQPVPSLEGRKPAELMDTPPGQDIVSNLVAMMETGAYA